MTESFPNLARLEREATEGPWPSDFARSDWPYTGAMAHGPVIIEGRDIDEDAQAQRDQDFIAAFRNVARALLDVAGKAQKLVDTCNTGGLCDLHWEISGGKLEKALQTLKELDAKLGESNGKI